MLRQAIHHACALRYTEATLLSAMENAGRLVDDPLLKKQMGGGLAPRNTGGH